MELYTLNLPTVWKYQNGTIHSNSQQSLYKATVSVSYQVMFLNVWNSSSTFQLFLTKLKFNRSFGLCSRRCVRTTLTWKIALIFFYHMLYIELNHFFKIPSPTSDVLLLCSVRLHASPWLLIIGALLVTQFYWTCTVHLTPLAQIVHNLIPFTDKAKFKIVQPINSCAKVARMIYTNIASIANNIQHQSDFL